MAHLGRTVKNAEAPRPLKSNLRSSLKNQYMVIEELIQLIENVAINLEAGINKTEPMASLVQNLRILGPQLETISKDTLDRAFVVFRNASQNESLNIMTRLNLLELIELRAKGWEDSGNNSYYKSKQAHSAELNDGQLHQHHHHQHLQQQQQQQQQQQHVVDPMQAAFLSTSPSFGGGVGGGSAAAAAAAAAAQAAAIAAVGSPQQQQMLLAPDEVLRNSGKFPKPTKIPGKTYCRDEVVIRNADSGKVNPGAKERLVQITGPAEEKINYAKQLIEDTIRRNASPVRLDPAHGAAGSCSSLASSNSDEPVTPRTPVASGAGGGGGLSNRLSFNSSQNFMTATAASQQQQHHLANLIANNNNASTPTGAVAKGMRGNQQILLHSYSTNDASVGEYKFTVNVGQHVIKITGDCCDLVRVSKLVLDDYFSSAEFLQSVDIGASLESGLISPITTPMNTQPQYMMGSPLKPQLGDSGIGLNYMSAGGGGSGSQKTNNNAVQVEADDDVFVDGNPLAKSGSSNNGLARSRRSHFSRTQDSVPEDGGAPSTIASISKAESVIAASINEESNCITYDCDHLLYYAKSPHSWTFPVEWEKIVTKVPSIIRNQVTKHDTSSINKNNDNITSSICTTTCTTATTTTTTTTTIPTPNQCTTTSTTTIAPIINSNANQDNHNNHTTTTTSSAISNNDIKNNAIDDINEPNATNNSTATAVVVTNINATTTTSTTKVENNVEFLLATTVVDSPIYPSSLNPFSIHFKEMQPPSVKRKGFFNRQAFSIDEEGYDALQQQQQEQQEKQHEQEQQEQSQKKSQSQEQEQQSQEQEKSQEKPQILAADNEYENKTNVNPFSVMSAKNDNNNKTINFNSNDWDAIIVPVNDRQRPRISNNQIKVISSLLHGNNLINKIKESHFANNKILASVKVASEKANADNDDHDGDGDDDVVFVGVAGVEEPNASSNTDNRTDNAAGRLNIFNYYRSNSTCD